MKGLEGMMKDSSDTQDCRFILVRNFTDHYGDVLFNDLSTCEDFEVIEGPGGEIRSPLLRFIRRVHLSPHINEIIRLPLKQIWPISLSKYPFLPDKKYFVFFVRDALPPEPISLQRLKKKWNIHFILLSLDHWDSLAEKKSRDFVQLGGECLFDAILTFDPKDAERYGFHYFDSFYSKIIKNPEVYTTEKDLYFIGKPKGRLDMLYRIFENRSDISFIVRINGLSAKECREIPGIIFNETIKYSAVIQEMLTCNCILEILSEGQTGASSRYYEAVCYNKKLLTNNKNVVNLPFYNPNYIHVFENPDDIDWDWVKERIPVDYRYDGRFSPTHLIDKIIELEKRKERKQNAKKETP